MPFSPSPQATLPPAQPATARSQQPPLSAQQPAYSFTVPSLHDDASLACRIYHPRDLLADEEDEGKGRGRKRRKAAVLAHPYAPLGGSYDDPVVGNVGAELLAAGWVVGTFCFRGAHASSGHHGVDHRHAAESSHSAKTSWLGKPELQDYVSFVGLMVEYMRCLHADQHERASSRDSAAPRTSLDASRTPGEEHSGHENEDESMYLILGGYSYGSLVASRLSPLPVLLSPFYSSAPAPPGSTPAEILLRAQHLAAETIAERRERGRDAFNKRRSPVTIGGEESDPEARRRSKEATRRSSRSLDLARGTEKLRRAWDKKRHHSGTSSPEPAVVEDSDEARQESGNSDEGGGGIGLMPPCRPAYLLISPLLPPTSLFIAPALATQGLPALSGLQFAAGLFGGRSQHAAASRSGGDAPVDPLLRCPTLAIWGEDDSFTSSKRLVRWAKGMQEEASSMSSGRPGVGNQLGFQGVAVEGASHFWQERGVMARLRAEVREWAGRIG